MAAAAVTAAVYFAASRLQTPFPQPVVALVSWGIPAHATHAASEESGVHFSVLPKRLKHFGEGALLSGCGVLKGIKKCKRGNFKSG